MSDSNTTPPTTEFGNMVRNRREELRLSREQLAALAVISEARLRQIENGWQHVRGGGTEPTRPRRSTVLKIAAALELPLNGALLAAGYEPVETDIETPTEVHENHRMLRLWQAMDPPAKAVVHDVMRAFAGRNRADEPEPLAS